MTEQDIHAQLRAIREVLDSLNTKMGAFSQAMHNPGDCDLKEKVALLEKADARRTGAFVVIGTFALLVGGGIVTFIVKVLGK